LHMVNTNATNCRSDNLSLDPCDKLSRVDLSLAPWKSDKRQATSYKLQATSCDKNKNEKNFLMLIMQE